VPSDGRLHAAHDFARYFEAGNVRRAGRRRVLAEPLHDVGPVDASRRHADQHLTLSRLRHRTLGEAEYLWAARRGDLDDAHRRSA
jgi:hypothetical protein